MRCLILTLAFLTLGALAEDAPVVPTPDTAGVPKAPKIDDYQRANPNDPRPAPDQKPPAGASAQTTLPGDAQEAQSPEARQKYVASVQHALETWDKRIAELAKKPATLKASEVLRTMRLRTDGDLVELGRVKGKGWLDVKARIESRFRRMEKEYEAIKA